MRTGILLAVLMVFSIGCAKQPMVRLEPRWNGQNLTSESVSLGEQRRYAVIPLRINWISAGVMEIKLEPIEYTDRGVWVIARLVATNESNCSFKFGGVLSVATPQRMEAIVFRSQLVRPGESAERTSAMSFYLGSSGATIDDSGGMGFKPWAIIIGCE